MREKRKFVRIPISMKIECFQNNPVGFGYGKNLSKEGLLVDAKAMMDQQSNFNIGTNIEIKFMLPGTQKTVSAITEITRIESNEENIPTLALKFIKIDPSCEKYLEMFIQEKTNPSIRVS